MHNNIMPIKTNSQYFSIFQLVMFDVLLVNYIKQKTYCIQ